MNRLTHFRGLTQEGVWVYGSYHSCVGTATLKAYPRHGLMHNSLKEEGLNEHYILVHNKPEYEFWGISDTFIYYKVIPFTVSQFTGFYDVNGAEVFEGDIISSHYNKKGIISVVKFDTNLKAYVCEDALGEVLYAHLVLMPSKKAKVAGNIHQINIQL